MNELSVHQLEDYKLSFDQLTKNQRGVITIKELKKMIESMGESPSDKELEEIFKASDMDGNGEIDFKEFCYLMARFDNEEDSEHIQVFKMLDNDKDGYITEKDLIQLLENTDLCNNLSVVKQLIKDGDFDGRISCVEFLALIKK
ncbi:hypothetical protein KR009_005162, partial [Drosophila setifemur]